MDIRFRQVDPADVRADLIRHLTALPSTIDSFLEQHILASTNFRILAGDRAAGFAAVHQGSLITQFALFEAFKHLGQAAFREARRLEQVTSAFVSTGDEFMLAHALDDFRVVTKQAYLFAAGPDDLGPGPGSGLELRPATPADIGLIRQESGEFFAPIDRYVDTESLFLTLRQDTVAGFGLIERSSLLDEVASIGMFTVAQCRGTGVGTGTIRLLRAECRERGWRPVAGCWYYNHASKRTLERAGMFSPSRLLRFEF